MPWAGQNIDLTEGHIKRMYFGQYGNRVQYNMGLQKGREVAQRDIDREQQNNTLANSEQQSEKYQEKLDKYGLMYIPYADQNLVRDAPSQRMMIK